MKLSKLKTISKNLLAKLLSILTLLLVLNGCSLFSRKEQPKITDPYCTKYVLFPDDEESKKYFLGSPVKMFEWGKINETTATCDCKPTPAQREKCWKKFLDAA